MENTLGRSGSSSAAGSQLLLIGLAALVMAVLVATLIARLTGYSTGVPAASPVLEMRQLGFRDLPRGVVEVYDWQSNETVARIESGEGSFLRGVVRSLVRQRRGLASTLQAPFELARYGDGRLVLLDTATGETIDLVAFGPTNVASFAVFLPGSGKASDPAAGDESW